jgi:hypothetical protein
VDPYGGARPVRQLADRDAQAVADGALGQEQVARDLARGPVLGRRRQDIALTFGERVDDRSDVTDVIGPDGRIRG